MKAETLMAVSSLDKYPFSFSLIKLEYHIL